MTLEDIKDKPHIKIPENLYAALHLQYLDEHGQPTEAGEFVLRGLCPAPYRGEYCGADSDPRSALGHCSRDYFWAGG